MLFQPPRLALAFGTRTSAVAFVGTFGWLVIYLVGLGNFSPDAFQRLTYVFPLFHNSCYLLAVSHFLGLSSRSIFVAVLINCHLAHEYFFLIIIALGRHILLAAAQRGESGVGVIKIAIHVIVG